MQEMEEQPTKYPFPKQVHFIIVFELLTGCGGYAISSMLVVYFINGLKMAEDQALVVYHMYVSLKTFFPLLGAVVADSFFGKFKTLVLGLIIYDLGLSLLLLGSFRYLALSPMVVTIVALTFLSVGSGLCLPCVAALGGDQFKLPEQEEQMSKYFQFFYWAINMGSLVGVIAAPMIRNMKCLDRNSCYPLAFGISILFMFVGHISIVVGGPFYVIKKPKINVVVKVSACIGYAIHQKIKTKEVKDHWLDHASNKYSEKLINDIKIMLDVMIIFVLLPIYWCLWHQQASDWTLLATKLDGDIGFYTILPEQTQILSKVFIVILLPLFHSVIEPIFFKYNFCVMALKRLALGFFLTGIAFIISGTIYFFIYADFPVPPKENSVQIRAYNPQSVSVQIDIKGIQDLSNISLAPFDHQDFLDVKFTKREGQVSFNNESISMTQKKCYSLITFEDRLQVFEDKIEKPEKDQFPRVRTIMASKSELVYKSKNKDFKFQPHGLNLTKMDAGVYKIIKDGKETFPETVKFKAGGVYVVLIDPSFKELKKIILVKENRISVFWIIPQFIILAMADVLVSATLIEFAYSQAPASQKTFLQAIKALTNAIGSSFVVLITELNIPHRGYNALIYAILMYLNMLLLMYIGKKYKYKTAEQLSE